MQTLRDWSVDVLIEETEDLRDAQIFLKINRPAGVEPKMDVSGTKAKVSISQDRMTITLGYERDMANAGADHWEMGVKLGDFSGDWAPVVRCVINHSSDTHEETIRLSGAGSGGDAPHKPAKVVPRFQGSSMRSSANLIFQLGRKPPKAKR